MAYCMPLVEDLEVLEGPSFDALPRESLCAEEHEGGFRLWRLASRMPDEQEDQ